MREIFSGNQETYLPSDMKAAQSQPVEGSICCQSCGKENQRRARFCGGCASHLILPRNTCVSTPDMLTWETLQQILLPLKNGFRYLKTFGKHLIDLRSKLGKPTKASLHAIILLVFGIISSFLLSGFASIHASFSNDCEKSLTWERTRRFVSQRLKLSLENVDILARFAWRKLPGADESVLCSQADLLQKVVQNEAQRNIRLFWAPLRDGLLDQENLVWPEKLGPEVLFPDVPTNHPVYFAWRNLLEHRAPVANILGNADPYGVITWSQWNRMVAFVLEKAIVSGFQDADLFPMRRGVMRSEDITQMLGILQDKSGLGPGSRPQIDLGSGIPNRLVAFSCLNNLLSLLTKDHGA